jgi:formylglycine-generating enzyme required for sulfatase activity
MQTVNTRQTHLKTGEVTVTFLRSGPIIIRTPFSEHVRLLLFLCWAALSVGPRAKAQTPPELDLQLHAGLSIAGAVGTVYSVEYVTDLALTNEWHCLTFLQLPATNYLWFDPTVPATSRRFYRATQFDAPTNLVFIPPGTFRMGSPTNEVDRDVSEGPQTAVTISRGFWMGKYEVTQGEYLALMGRNPSNFIGDTNRPVEQVSWFESTNYCGKLTQRERAAGRIATNCVYRLPTEAEWEYAARGWTSTRFSYGDDPGYTDLANYAWYADNSGQTTHPVGLLLPNPWGLYDMHGNVWEWCQDRWALPQGGTALDPQGPATGADRVFRGGSLYGPAAGMRSAERIFSAPPTTTMVNVGLRVVLAPGQP